MRICGAKYEVCGPKTATGLPLADSAAETTSALDMPIVRRPAGSRPSVGARLARVAAAPAPLPPATTCVRRSEPASAIAIPPRAGRLGGVWYGKRRERTVVGASASS